MAIGLTWFVFDVTTDGRFIAGSASLEPGKLVTVRVPGKKTSTQIGGSDPEILARVLLRELLP